MKKPCIALLSAGNELLKAAPHLWSNIEVALSQSEYLIYMASPLSASSKWAAKEVEYWLENKSIDKLLIVLTDGDILWDDVSNTFLNKDKNSLPDILENKFTEEPFYIDLRFARTEQDISLLNPIFNKEVLKLAAQLHGKEPKDLAGEEVTEHHKVIRLRNIIVSVLALLVVLSSSAAWIAKKNLNEARKQKNIAVKQEKIAIEEKNIAQANYLISEAKSAAENDPTLALRLAEAGMALQNDPALVRQS